MNKAQKKLADLNLKIERNPNDAWALAHRGETYRLMERYQEALQDFDRAIELDPEDDWYRYLRALVYLARSQPDLTKADLDTAIQLAQQKYTEKPKNCQNVFNLALYHLVAGNLPTATEFYQTALQQTASQSKIQEAIQDLKDLLQVFPQHPTAQQVIATLEQKLKLH